jgi:ferredoxin
MNGYALRAGDGTAGGWSGDSWSADDGPSSIGATRVAPAGGTPAQTARPVPWSVAIDDRCTACGACLSTCPEHALLPAARRPLVVDARCTGCGECVEICPRGAISDVWHQ